jgi:hypothetical protein
MASLRSSSVFISLVGTAAIAPSSILAGCVAGHVARRRQILHGALSSCAWLLLLMLISLFGPPGPGSDVPPPRSGFAASSILITLFGALISVGVPLLGALGGAIDQKRSSRNRPSAQQNRNARSMSPWERQKLT